MNKSITISESFATKVVNPSVTAVLIIGSHNTIVLSDSVVHLSVNGDYNVVLVYNLRDFRSYSLNGSCNLVRRLPEDLLKRPTEKIVEKGVPHPMSTLYEESPNLWLDRYQQFYGGQPEQPWKGKGKFNTPEDVEKQSERLKILKADKKDEPSMTMEVRKMNPNSSFSTGESVIPEVEKEKRKQMLLVDTYEEPDPNDETKWIRHEDFKIVNAVDNGPTPGCR